MDSIEQHIEVDKKILEDPSVSPQMRRHTADELQHLEKYHDAHPEDHHDPTSFEMYCDENPEAEEFKLYEDSDTLRSVTGVFHFFGRPFII